jgi:hypothetical protein
VGGPSTEVLGPLPPLSQFTGDTKQRKGVIQHRAHLAGSSSSTEAVRRCWAQTAPKQHAPCRGQWHEAEGGEGAGQGEGGAKTQRAARRTPDQLLHPVRPSSRVPIAHENTPASDD